MDGELVPDWLDESCDTGGHPALPSHTNTFTCNSD